MVIKLGKPIIKKNGDKKKKVLILSCMLVLQKKVLIGRWVLDRVPNVQLTIMAGRTEMILRMNVVVLLHLGFGTRKKERKKCVACMNGDSVKGPRA
jgi:hypothetical protein